MRTVIYDSEAYEPLTVVDIPQKVMRAIETGERWPEFDFLVLVPEQPRQWADMSSWENATAEVRRVHLRFEPIYRGQDPKPFVWLCVTSNAETALLLRSTFLPGQRREANARQEQAFMQGMLRALSA